MRTLFCAYKLSQRERCRFLFLLSSRSPLVSKLISPRSLRQRKYFRHLCSEATSLPVFHPSSFPQETGAFFSPSLLRLEFMNSPRLFMNLCRVPLSTFLLDRSILSNFEHFLFGVVCLVKPVADASVPIVNAKHPASLLAGKVNSLSGVGTCCARPLPNARPLTNNETNYFDVHLNRTDARRTCASPIWELS